MHITIFCSSCFAGAEFDPAVAETSQTCRGCGKLVTFAFSERMKNENVIDVCGYCSNRAFYVEKDFNRNLGWLLILVTVGLFTYVATTVWARWAVLVLVGVTMLDAVVYFFVPSRTICYRCQAEYRRFAPNPEHQPYEHKVAARYAEYRDREKPQY